MILPGLCLPEPYHAKLAVGYYGYTRATHEPPVSGVCFMIKWVWGDEVLQQTFHFLIKQVISLRVRVLNERKRMLMRRMIKIIREYFFPFIKTQKQTTIKGLILTAEC